jgi:3-oxoacyl-[acyl-carrier protein] reductase
MFNLTGKTAFITGASGGIGGAIAKALHAHGATVGLHGRNVEALEKLGSELQDRYFIFTGDLGNAGAVDEVLASVDAKMGGVDILVNNAGLTRDNLFLRLKDEDWATVIDINLTIPFRLAKACAKGMMKKRWGRVINITSIVGVTGNPGQANYAASKAGLIGMTKSMAAEVASRNVTMNCVAPGFIATAMTDALTEEQKAELTKNIPSGTLGTPEDVAACVLFLASDEAKYMTGQTLHVNGGMAMI